MQCARVLSAGGGTVLGGTGLGSAVGCAVLGMGGVHRVPVPWGGSATCHRQQWGQPRCPSPAGEGALSFVPEGPVCSLHRLCSEAAANPSRLNNKLRKQEPAGRVN